MGVDSFFKIRISGKNAKDAKLISSIGETIDLSSLSGERVCVDASLMIYSSILAMERVTALTDAEGKTTTHINTIFNKVIELNKYNISQIWIFDSPKPNEFKTRALEKRRERREKAAKELEKDEKESEKEGEKREEKEANKNNKRNKNEKLQYHLNEEHVNDIKSLLQFMGIMYIEAPPGIEAEQYGAFITRGTESQRYCKYMISGDSDVLSFGGNLLRISSQKSATGKSRKTIYQVFELDNVLNQLGLNYDKFLEMCVVMGTDFNEKLRDVGPAKVLNKIKQDELVLTPRQEMIIGYYKSDITDKIGESVRSQNDYDRKDLIEFLKSKNFDEVRINKRLENFNQS